MCSFSFLSQFYPFGYSHNDSSLPPSYNSISEGIQLSEDFIFYNEKISNIYVRTPVCVCMTFMK